MESIRSLPGRLVRRAAPAASFANPNGLDVLRLQRKADAARTFQSVGGADGTAELARRWLMFVQRPS